MAKTREYLFYSDATMCNPNGNLIDDNRPRQDERTQLLEMSDARIKRYIRDEWDNRGERVFVKPVKNEKGKYLDCKGVSGDIQKQYKIAKENVEQYLKDNYKDVKLFGAVITEPKFNILGPLQIMWSKSVHEADIIFAQGTSVFSSKEEGTKQGTFWEKYYTPYALFKTYMVYNDMVAKRQNIEITESDLSDFADTLICGVRNYKSTSKNQIPRLLVEVIYHENFIDGELDYIKVNKVNDMLTDLELRSIQDFEFDLSPLVEYAELYKDKIAQIKIYKHPKVSVTGDVSQFAVITI